MFCIIVYLSVLPRPQENGSAAVSAATRRHAAAAGQAPEPAPAAPGAAKV